MNARAGWVLAALLVACSSAATGGGGDANGGSSGGAGSGSGGNGSSSGASGSSSGASSSSSGASSGSSGGVASDAGADASTSANDAAFASLVAYVKQQLATHDVPGASIAVVLDGKLAYSAGVGVKSHGGADPVTAATLFRVGSMSKMIVAAATMTLVEAGKVDPAKPVTSYLPSFKLAGGDDASAIHVANLLTHTSGIQEQTIETCAAGPGELAKWFAANPQPAWAPPGAVWNYCNLGISLAGLVVEAASGQAFEDYVKAHVFDPAGMTSATYDPATAKAADHAVGWGYDTKGSGNTVNEEPDAYDCSIMRPPGGVMASAVDYAHFAEMLLAHGGSTLASTSVDAMTKAQVDTHEFPTEHYGYGLFVDDGYKGLHSIQHGGSIPGFLTSFWMVPDRGFAVTILTNAESYDPVDSSVFAVDAFLAPPNVPPPVLTTPPSTWTPYAGTYADKSNAIGGVTVALANGQLTVTVPSIQVTNGALTQIADDLFELPDPQGGEGLPFVFWRDGPTSPVTYVVTPIGDAKKN